MTKIAIQLKNPSTKINYSRPQLDIDYYPAFLSPTEVNEIWTQLDSHLNFTTNVKHKRTTYIYGQPNLTYTIEFKGQSFKRQAIDWQTLPILQTLRNRIAKLTGQEANFCVIQYYPTGRVTMQPHRDKEITPGTSICGLSLGSIRTLHLDPPRWWGKTQEIDRLSLNLGQGSLYVLNPPTNDCWAHSIDKSDSQFPRLSLTFRLIK